MLKKAQTENGWVRGTSAADPRIIVYRGIPFAAPPVGNLRWMAPQPAKNWEGMLDCVEFTPIPMQAKPGTDKTSIYTREWNVDPELPMSEDCLYLNIWTPANSTDEKLPVYVWFFGGGLQVGNPAEMEFDGERIARRGVVVVSVNYRLNAFGFLCHPEITKEAPDAPANFGHLDQQFGLRWTKRNIAAFGGDPDNITIGGQSAGAGSVLVHLNCPDNKGWFQKAIIQSGLIMNTYAQFNPKTELPEAEREGEQFFEYLGVKTLEEARALPAEFIRDKCVAYGKMWLTVFDGVFQKNTYMTNIFFGDYIDVPILLGNTKNEFIMRPPVKDMDELKAYAKSMFGDKDAEFLSLIKAEEGFDAAMQNAALVAFEYSTLTALRRMDQRGVKGPHFYYEFDPEMPGWDNPGSFHSSDLWFWFETLAKCWRPFKGKHYDLARQMCNYWANFIRSGDPNGNDADGTPMETWEAYTDAKPVYMTLYEAPKAEVRKPSPLMELLISAKADYKD